MSDLNRAMKASSGGNGTQSTILIIEVMNALAAVGGVMLMLSYLISPLLSKANSSSRSVPRLHMSRVLHNVW